MAELRVTKKMYFQDIVSLLNGETPTHGTTVEKAIEVMEKEIGLLVKKNSSDSKKKAQAREAMAQDAATVYEYMVECGKAVTCSDIIANIPTFATLHYSTQKVRPIMSYLMDEGKVERLVDKGKSLFAVKAS